MREAIWVKKIEPFKYVPKMLSELTRMSLQLQRVRYAINEGYVARYKE